MFEKENEMFKKGYTMASSDLSSEGIEGALRNICDIWYCTDWDGNLKEGYLNYIIDYVSDLEQEIMR